MPQNFVYPPRDQPLLLPVDMREWLPEDDLVLIVLDAVASSRRPITQCFENLFP